MFSLLARIFRILLRIVIAFLVLSVGFTWLYGWVPVPLTPLMLIRCVEQKSEGREMVLRHDWVKLEKISPNLQLAVVCSEDQNFLRHRGFDWKSIEKAMDANSRGKRLKGASTISQQTAKNVFLWPGRSYVRKGFEAYFTFLIETFWSKRRIMEVYLNSIEMGNGIYGAEAAARHWFQKPADSLTKEESAALAAILPNPRKYVAHPPSAYISRRKAWIRKQMGFLGNQLNYDEYNSSDDDKKESQVKRKRN